MALDNRFRLYPVAVRYRWVGICQDCKDWELTNKTDNICTCNGKYVHLFGFRTVKQINDIPEFTHKEIDKLIDYCEANADAKAY